MTKDEENMVRWRVAILGTNIEQAKQNVREMQAEMEDLIELLESQPVRFERVMSHLKTPK